MSVFSGLFVGLVLNPRVIQTQREGPKKVRVSSSSFPISPGAVWSHGAFTSGFVPELGYPFHPKALKHNKSYLDDFLCQVRRPDPEALSPTAPWDGETPATPPPSQEPSASEMVSLTIKSISECMEYLGLFSESTSLETLTHIAKGCR